MTLQHLRLTVVAPLAVGIVLLVVFGATLLVTSRAGDDVVHRSVESIGEATYSVASRDLFDPLYRQDIGALREDLGNLVQDESITYAAVRDASGRIVAQQSDGWTPELDTSDTLASEALAQRSPQHRHFGRNFLISGPIAAGTEQIGTLEIGIDHAPVTAAVGSMRRSLFLYVLPLLATAALVVMLFTRLAMRPLGTLGAAASRIGSGRLDTAIPVSGMSETRALGAALERMRTGIQAAQAELEQRVLERTSELSTANAALEEALAERERAEEELRLRGTALESAANAIVITDRDGRITWVNPAFSRLTGYAVEEAIGQTPRLLNSGVQSRAFYKDLWDTILSGRVWRGEVVNKRKDGRTYTEEMTITPVRDARGRPTHFIAIKEDITERKQADELLLASQAATQAVLDTAVDGIISIDERGVVESFNPAAERMFGYSAAEVLGRNLSMLMPPPYQDEHDGYLARYRHTESPTVIGCGREVEGRRKDGTVFPLDLSVAEVKSGGRRTFTGFVRDITERKRLEEQLLQQARCDTLTGVLNHGTIVAELDALLSDAAGAVSHTVAMVDVDGLKAVNDTYGHQLGDAVLVAIARALTRDEALVGRYGGDEFVAVLRDTDRLGAERYRDAVTAALAGAAVADPETGERVPVAASIGLAVFPAEADTIAGLIRLADSAMYATRRQRPVRNSTTGEAPSFSDDAAEIVAQIVPLLAACDDLDDKLRLVAQRISAGAGYDAVSIDVFSQRHGPPTARTAAADVDDSVVEKWRADRRPAEDDPFVQTLLRVRRGIIVEDPQNDARLTDAQRDVLRTAELRSAVVVPLLLEDDLIGIISAASKREAAFSPRDVQLLTTVGIQVTAIVRMATLLQDLQSSSDRIAQARTETVMLLAASAEAHDHTTGLHLQGVRALTQALALGLGQSPEDAHELGLAAVLHDIGKVRVPDSILSHTGKLAAEDWELMKHHSIWGEQLLAGRPGFDLAACIARSHHERWDGGGYPDGLAGEEIPPPARIVAVADALDAMTSDRPYRRARPLDTALQEIASCSGSQFSPDVVTALLRLHERGELPAAPSEGAEQPEAA